MEFKLKNNIYAKLYLNQIIGRLLLNGRPIQSESIRLHIMNNFLNSLSISVNIITDKRRKTFIMTNKLFLEISKRINEIIGKEKKFLNIKSQTKNDKEKINTNKSLSIFHIINTKFMFILIVILVIILVFIIDYKRTIGKIDEANISEIKEIEKNYRLNKCVENGHLPALKDKCESMLNKIEILKNKKSSITTLSTFSVWIVDPINTIMGTFETFKYLIIGVLTYLFYKYLM